MKSPPDLPPNRLRHGILLDAYRLLPLAWLSWLREMEHRNSSNDVWEAPVTLQEVLVNAAAKACVDACRVLNFDKKNADGPVLEHHLKLLLPVDIQVPADEPLAVDLAAAGVRLVALGQIEEALRCFHDALQVTPTESPLRNVLLTNILRVVLEIGDREYLTRHVRSYLGTAAGCPTTLGMALLETGRAAQAREFFQNALTQSVAQLGPSHPDVAVDLANLAAAHFRLDEFEEARDCLLRSRTIARQEMAPDDPRRSTIENLWTELEAAAPAN